MLFILSGTVGAGKTTFLEGLTALFRGMNIDFCGYLSLRVVEKEKTAGYDLFDLRSGERGPFLRRSGEPEWQCVGPYFVLPEGLDRAENIIRRSRPADLLIIDEVGPLELEGNGLWPVLREVLKDGSRRLLVVAREELADVFRELFTGHGHKIKIIEFDENAFVALMAEIEKP